MTPEPAHPGAVADRPPRAGLVLTTLTVGAIVANINLSIGNVALPDIGRDLGASQVQRTMVASMFTLGLAASVLSLGAIGDSYGRKLLLLAGAALSIPTSLASAFAPNIEVLVAARLLGGLAAGLLFPTTLSLISALWRGKALTRAISMWSGLGGAAAAIGSLVGGALLVHFWWGSVFLLTAPFALLVFVAAWIVVPWHAGEERVAVDHVGGVLSVVAVALLVTGIQRLPNGFTAAMGVQFAVAVAFFALFIWRQRRAPRPLVDLKAASVPTFWVAAVAGTITFGSLIGAMFLGQQFTQNVLGYDALTAAIVNLPSPICMMITAVAAGKIIVQRGSRDTFAGGLVFVALGFVAMAFWSSSAGVGLVLGSYALVGMGVGLAATAASHTLMASLPVSRAGMGSAFTDLTRDFGGAIMQALMGTVLAVVYADNLVSAFNKLSPQEAAQLSQSAAQQIVGSYEGATQVAAGFPQAQAHELVAAAANAFTEGKTVAYLLGLGLTVVAFVLVLWKYPGKSDEQAFFAQIEQLDRQQSRA